MSNEKTLPTRWDGQPEPLAPLDYQGKKIWKHLIASIPKKILCAADSAVLTAMCKAWSSYIKYEKQLAKLDKLDWNLFSAMRSVQNQFNAGAKQFGLSPLERNKITPQGTGRDTKPDKEDAGKNVPPPSPLDGVLSDLNKAGKRYQTN